MSSPPGPGADPPPALVLTLTVSTVTSFVVFTQRRVRSLTGSHDELRAFARRTLTHNLLLGWWGFPFGLIWTPMTLWRNRKARRQLDVLAASALPPEGWYPDPRGRGLARYWDGAAWTDRIRTETQDAMG